MKIENKNVNGYKLRCKQGKWYFQLFFRGKDLKVDYGPFTYNEAQEFIAKYDGELVDIDRELTKAKVDSENLSL